MNLAKRRLSQIYNRAQFSVFYQRSTFHPNNPCLFHGSLAYQSHYFFVGPVSKFQSLIKTANVCFVRGKKRFPKICFTNNSPIFVQKAEKIGHVPEICQKLQILFYLPIFQTIFLCLFFKMLSIGPINKQRLFQQSQVKTIEI